MKTEVLFTKLIEAGTRDPERSGWNFSPQEENKGSLILPFELALIPFSETKNNSKAVY